VLAGLTKSEEERRKQNEVIAAKERELRRQQRRQNRPLVDSTLIRTSLSLSPSLFAFSSPLLQRVCVRVSCRVVCGRGAATQTVVLFVRRDFDKQLAEHLKKQARDK
jgi:hypothetical protein